MKRIQYANKLIELTMDMTETRKDKAKSYYVQFINGDTNKASFYASVMELVHEQQREQKIKDELAIHERHERISYANQAISKIQLTASETLINQARDLALDYVNEKIDTDAFAKLLDDLYTKMNEQPKKKATKTKVKAKEIKESPVLKDKIDAKPVEKKVKSTRGRKPKVREVEEVQEVTEVVEVVKEVKPKKTLTKEELEAKQIADAKMKKLIREAQIRKEETKREKKVFIEKLAEPLVTKCLTYDLDEQLVELQELQADYMNTTEEQIGDMSNKIEVLISKVAKDRVKEDIATAILKGTPLSKVIEETELGEEKIYDLANKLVKKEKISPQQEKLIVMYGVIYKSDVNELLHHVGCSELKCREVIAKYEERLAKGENIWTTPGKKKK